MSMRAHDLHSPYRHRRATGPDPVNIILLVSIFALSGFLFYSVSTTAMYVPVAGQTTPAQKAAVLNNEPVNLPEAAKQNTINSVTEQTPSFTVSEVLQVVHKRWDEKPPYVREERLQIALGEYKTSKVSKVVGAPKRNPAGILQR